LCCKRVEKLLAHDREGLLKSLAFGGRKNNCLIGRTKDLTYEGGL
jgi:hypothetical protein